MEWGLRIAQEMGLEVYLDASDIGKPLYQKYGFVEVGRTDLQPTDRRDSAEWEELEKKLPPFHTSHMWKPAGAQCEEGVTVKPWEATKLLRLFPTECQR